MVDSDSVLAVGHLVPDYELLRRIGGGSYGEVWLARSKATGALRAAKIVWRRSFDDDRPFRREFEGIQRFESISREHPSQLALFHIGRNDAQGCFYYVMELADNIGTVADYAPRTLRADLRKGRLPAESVLQVGVVLSEALGHLHQKGLVHRDVKPSNVIFVNGRPKLADIGLLTDASDTHSIVGTEGYLPPEGPGAPQADIFALGKVLYEAATGLDRQRLPQLPPDLRDWPEAKQVFEINEIILRACAQDAQERYETCEQIRADLELIQRGKSVKKQRTRQQFRATGKKIALVLGAVAAIAAMIFIGAPRPSRSETSSDGPPSTNMEANAFCEKAMLTLRGDNIAEFTNLYTNFSRAIALDPNFARPYIGLLELRLREDVKIPGLSPTTKEDLRSIARNLKRLAPHLAATYTAQSVVNWEDWNYPEALRNSQEAIRVDPDFELGHTYFSWLLSCFGWPEECLKQVELAQKLAPSKTIIYRAFGNAELAARHYPKAIDWYKQAITWEPHHFVPYAGIGESLEAMGDYKNALDFLEKAEILSDNDEAKTTNGYAILRRALDKGGIPAYWEQHWKWTTDKTNAEFYWKAVIQIHLGNTNGALHWLEKSYEVREGRNDPESPMGLLLYDPYWDGLRDEPRFRQLLDKVGYTKVMPPRKR